MVECVTGGENYPEHMAEVAKMATELAVTALEFRRDTVSDPIEFLKVSHNMCPHIANVLLFFIASGSLDGIRAIDSTVQDGYGLVQVIRSGGIE
jgi:hypothetical protein